MRLFFLVAAIAMMALPQAALAQPVYFNHGFVNVSPATFDAIKASSFVTDELGSAKSGSVETGASAPGWSGYYLYGERTYLEFFPSSADDPLGKIGIGLSIDDRRQLPGLATRLSETTGVPFPLGKQSRKIEGVEIDWFDATGPDYGEARTPLLDFWVMGHYPTYLRQRYPDLTSEEDGATRKKLLARQYRPTGLLQDIAGVSLVLSDVERVRLLKQLGGAGYVISRRSNSDVAKGPDFSFSVSTASALRPRSITYHLLLNRAAKPRTLKLGSSTLTIQRGATATWHFRAQGDAVK